MVYMERLRTLWIEHLDEGVVPVRLLARGLDGDQATEPPSRFSFTFLEPEGLICDVFVHWLLLAGLPRGLY
jgi:hypothetical protein